MSDFLKNISYWFTKPQSLLAAFTAVVLIFQLFYLFRRSLRDLTIGYRIAVIGLPRAGKTALIGSIFNRMFYAESGERFNPVGQETIHRVNRIIANLDSRTPLPPTRETDVFVFRFIFYKLGSLILRKIRYEGEVVDFPGELSQKLLDSAEDGLISDDIGIFHKEFFSWLISSRVHILVIDLAQYLLAQDRAQFVAQMTAEMRSAWQLLNEEFNQSVRPPERKVAIVFTKSDILDQFETLNLTDFEKESVRAMGFEKPPESRAQNNESYVVSVNEELVVSEFSDLIYYFQRQKCISGHFFVSSYRSAGARSGLSRLVSFILPGGGAVSRPKYVGF